MTTSQIVLIVLSIVLLIIFIPLLFIWAVNTLFPIQEENEALRKDAERYRWLRECSPFRSDRSVRVVQENYVNGVFKGENFLHVESLDAAIDAAIKEGS